MKKFLAILALCLLGTSACAQSTLPGQFMGAPGLFFYDSITAPVVRVSSATPLPVSASLVSTVANPFYNVPMGSTTVTPVFVVATGSTSGINNGAKVGGSIIVSVNPNTPTVITLPAGASGIWINAIGADMLVGNASELATGAIYVGFPIVDGCGGYWDKLGTTTPTLAIISNEAGVSATATIVKW
jgi:hypothetical protein